MLLNLGGFALNTVFCVFYVYSSCIPFVLLCISAKPFRTPDTWQIREEYMGIHKRIQLYSTAKFVCKLQCRRVPTMSIVKKARATNPLQEWMPLGAPEFGTMAEAKKHLQNMEASKWKWARPPGDGKTQARFCCTTHVDCERLLRVKLDGFMYILEGLGEHSLVPTLKKRSNSTLTLDMEKRVRESMDQGGTSYSARFSTYL